MLLNNYLAFMLAANFGVKTFPRRVRQSGLQGTYLSSLVIYLQRLKDYGTKLLRLA